MSVLTKFKVSEMTTKSSFHHIMIEPEQP